MIARILFLMALLFSAPALADDPCANPANTRQVASISISTATTTELVALSGTKTIYVCGFSLTISQVVTTANTLRFQYGTGSTCGTGTTNITGLLGGGGITAGLPIVLITANSNTLFSTAAGNALCALTAIGATASFQGFVTYVQI